jgi:lysozyme family protein
MPSVSLTAALRSEYELLFNTCLIRPERADEVNRLVDALADSRARYAQVERAIGVPWFFVAVVHNMECSQRFSGHLHNGDPLTRRTSHVPAGRPKNGNPPFAWEGSACDALQMKALGADTDWSLAGTLYQLERYNGWGYRLYHAHVLSPYLWSYSTHYESGKYTADGTWSDTAPSKQCGAAVLLRRMAENGQVEFPDQPRPTASAKPLVVRFSTKRPVDPAQFEAAKALQRWLNTFPGVFVKVDGIPGKRTSNAYLSVTGQRLSGDPR